jgi:hypothetical protein
VKWGGEGSAALLSQQERKEEGEGPRWRVGLKQGINPGASGGRGGGAWMSGVQGLSHGGGSGGKKNRGEGEATDKWGPGYCAVVKTDSNWSNAVHINLNSILNPLKL